MKNILLLLLFIPILSIAQKKSLLKERIIQKNDSITVFINQINQLDNKLKKLKIDISEVEGSNTKLLENLHEEKEKNKNLTKTFSVLNQEINDLKSYESSKNIFRLLLGFENINIDDSFIDKIIKGEVNFTFLQSLTKSYAYNGYVDDCSKSEIDSISIFADSISISVDIYMKYIRDVIDTHETIYQTYIDINHDGNLDLFQNINDQGHHWGNHSQIYLYDTLEKKMVDMKFDVYPYEFCDNLGLEHGEGYSRPYSSSWTNGVDIWYYLNCYDWNSHEETHYILHYVFNTRINTAVYIDYEINSERY